MWLKGAVREVGKFVAMPAVGNLRSAALADEYREAGVPIPQDDEPEFAVAAEADAEELAPESVAEI